MDVDGAAASAASDGRQADDAGHRVLVFAQLRSLLDIVARDLLQPAGVPFLRLDGGCAHSMLHVWRDHNKNMLQMWRQAESEFLSNR